MSNDFDDELERLYEDPEPIICPECNGTGRHPYRNLLCCYCDGTGQFGPRIGIPQFPI